MHKDFDYARFRSQFVAGKARLEGLSVYQRINVLGDLKKEQHNARMGRLVDRHARRRPELLIRRWRKHRNWWMHNPRMWRFAHVASVLERPTEDYAIGNVLSACYDLPPVYPPHVEFGGLVDVPEGQ